MRYGVKRRREVKKASLNLMSHTGVTTPSTLRLLLARTTPGPQRSRAESRRLLLARDYSWTVTPPKNREWETPRMLYIIAHDRTRHLNHELLAHLVSVLIDKCNTIGVNRRYMRSLLGSLYVLCKKHTLRQVHLRKMLGRVATRAVVGW